MAFGKTLGDFISGLGYYASGLTGSNVQLYPGGLGSAISGNNNPSYSNSAPTYASSAPAYGPQKPQSPQGPYGPVAPSTGGQPTGGGGGNGANINLTAPVNNQPNVDVLGNLRNAYSSARDNISNEQGGLDSSYANAKNDIQGSLDDATKQAATQKDSLNTQFGDVLKNQLRTYQDLGRQRQGTFSALGTLDSSQYQEQQFRADQDLADQESQTNLQKTNALKSVDDQFNTFSRQANSQLADLANQYQQGKNAIASALANNNIQEAGAIQQALQQISDQANQIQNSVINFQNQAQLLKAQGYNVRTNIAGINGNQYAQQTNNNLGNLTTQQQQLFTLPTKQATGQGYIGNPNNKDDLNRLLAGIGATA